MARAFGWARGVARFLLTFLTVRIAPKVNQNLTGKHLKTSFLPHKNVEGLTLVTVCNKVCFQGCSSADCHSQNLFFHVNAVEKCVLSYNSKVVARWFFSELVHIHVGTGTLSSYPLVLRRTFIGMSCISFILDFHHPYNTARDSRLLVDYFLRCGYLKTVTTLITKQHLLLV